MSWIKVIVFCLFSLCIIVEHQNSINISTYHNSKDRYDYQEEYLDTESVLKIENFKCFDPDGNPFNLTDLIKGGISAFFIFSEKCPSCDSNLFYWEKICKVFKGDFKAIGIILSPGEDLKRFTMIKKTSFKVFRPENQSHFKVVYKINFMRSKTLLIKEGKIVFSKIGEINPEDYFKIRQIIKGGY